MLTVGANTAVIYMEQPEKINALPLWKCTIKAVGQKEDPVPDSPETPLDFIPA